MTQPTLTEYQRNAITDALCRESRVDIDRLRDSLVSACLKLNNPLLRLLILGNLTEDKAVQDVLKDLTLKIAKARNVSLDQVINLLINLLELNLKRYKELLSIPANTLMCGGVPCGEIV